MVHDCAIDALNSTTQVSNSKFSFSKTGCLTKAKELSLPYYLFIAKGRRTVGFILFPKVSISSMWTTKWSHSGFEPWLLIPFPSIMLSESPK